MDYEVCISKKIMKFVLKDGIINNAARSMHLNENLCTMPSDKPPAKLSPPNWYDTIELTFSKVSTKQMMH